MEVYHDEHSDLIEQAEELLLQLPEDIAHELISRVLRKRDEVA